MTASQPEDRLTLGLAGASIALCLGGVMPFLWFAAHADWGQGGELQGVSLVLGAVMWTIVWALSSLAGLVLALMASRRPRGPGSTRLPRAALWVNALSLVSLLSLVLLNVLRAQAE